MIIIIVDADIYPGGGFKALKFCLYLLYSIRSTDMFCSEKEVVGFHNLNITSQRSVRVLFSHDHDNIEISYSVCEQV